MAKTVREVVSAPGRPLDPATRAFFEPRFGFDFGPVRLHDDARAGSSARAVEAQAYTVGSHVVFGPQAYRPGSESGRRLIAHELAHVVQQRGVGSVEDTSFVDRISRPGERLEAEAEAASARVLRGAAPMFPGAAEAGVLHRAGPNAQPSPAAPFYQEAIDALAAERRQIITIVRAQVIPESVPVLEKLVELCEAIDRGAVDDVKTLLGEFLAANADHLPPNTPSNSLTAEMTSRMLLLGLEAESGRLRQWGVNREKGISHKYDHVYSIEIWAWEEIEERLLGQIPETGGAAGLKALDGLLLFLGQLLSERFSLNEEEIKKDAEIRARLYDNPFVQNDRSIAVYAAELVRLMTETFAGIQAAFQLVLDQAVEDLAAGRGEAMLASAKDRLDNRLLPLIEPADKSRRVGGVAVETTRSELDEGGGVHYDVFAKTEAARKKRSVKVHFYDAEQVLTNDMETSSDFSGVFLARRRQIELIEQIYGLQKDDQGNLTAETRENAAAMGGLGAEGLRLHNDDDWRRFVVEKFKQREPTEGAEKALIAVIDLLGKYMRVFTTHTPYNIEDFGDNLLTKTFPRDLAGRLIHDCGVYGLRMAYILSLLRDELNLRFRYVVMPLHVGLLITGDGLPTFLVNNDSITSYTAADAAKLRGEWGRFDEEGAEGAPARPGTEARFSGELMADEFVSGVDLPYQQMDVVKTSGSPAAMKERLWRQYTSEISPAVGRLFGPSVRDPKSPNYQFYLSYLKLLDMFKEHHNNSVVPFWNVTAARLWDENKAAIQSAFSGLRSAAPKRRAAAQAAYDTAVKTYADRLEDELGLVQQAAGPIVVKQVEIQVHIAAHPDVFAPGTEVASADRVRAMFAAVGVTAPLWEKRIRGHLDDLRGGTRVEAPFEKPEDKLMPLN